MATSENPQLDLQLPVDFPYWWCSDYGEDEYGVFMGFTFQGIRQGFRWIPPGTFLRNALEDEREKFVKVELHKVTLTKGFWLSETTCSQEMWESTFEINPSRFLGKSLPVDSVTWYEVQDFIKELNSIEKELKLRLPTEAEWEFACRSGSSSAYWFGNTLDADLANCGLRKGKPMPVKSLKLNPFGLYHMHGNVREWCSDWYGNYPRKASADPIGPLGGTSKVLRGGSWASNAERCRSSSRMGFRPSAKDYLNSFRFAREG